MALTQIGAFESYVTLLNARIHIYGDPRTTYARVNPPTWSTAGAGSGRFCSLIHTEIEAAIS